MCLICVLVPNKHAPILEVGTLNVHAYLTWACRFVLRKGRKLKRSGHHADLSSCSFQVLSLMVMEHLSRGPQ